MKKIALTISVLFTTLFCISQNSKDSSFISKWIDREMQSGLMFEVSYQERLSTSLGAMAGFGYGKIGQANFGVGACVDLFYDGSNSIFGPRIFYAGTLYDLVGLRVGVGNYFMESTKDQDTRVLMELSLNLGGKLNFNGGFSFPVGNNYFDRLGAFRAGVTINIMR